MVFDFATLDNLRRNHPAWRLLLADYAPLVLSFLHRAFIQPNIRGISQSELGTQLEDALFELRRGSGADLFPRSAADYLDDWAQDSRGWLRKYYPPGIDEAHFDLTPATEKALGWLEQLTTRSFVGTESRLRVVFDLLREIVQGSEADPEERISELERQRADIDRQIRELRAGHVPTLDDTAIRERFHHLAGTARELLADFREVEQNFRNLDRSTRERIATRDGAKGAVLADVLGQRDSITDSDQGKSFRAFWDFLMSTERQEELGALLDKAFALPAIHDLRPDRRLRRIHYDWLEAGEHTQRTVALLSRQLRRFLDDQVWLENRRIMELIRDVEGQALALRECQPAGAFMSIDPFSPDIELPLERPLYIPPFKAEISRPISESDDEPLDAAPLYDLSAVDRAVLRSRIEHELSASSQVLLSDLIARHPLEHGLSEVVAWLELGAGDPDCVISEEIRVTVDWTGLDQRHRQADMPEVIFTRRQAKEVHHHGD